MDTSKCIIVMDFGGQYKELIARVVREMGVYSLILPSRTPAEKLREYDPAGIIFSGGPHSVYKEGAPSCDPGVFSLNVPVLGICYGMQYAAQRFGGKVQPGTVSEYGETKVELSASPLFKGLSSRETMLMSHTDIVSEPPAGFTVTASTENCPVAAMEDRERKIYCVQFHPEVNRSAHGKTLLFNFIFDICGAHKNYSLEGYIESQITSIREQVKDKNVLLGLSGGVDSAVAAALIAKALPGRLLCVYVDHGFMRKNETEQIKTAFSSLPLKLEAIDARAQFLQKIKGVTDPEQKRKIIGGEFVKTFAEAAKKYGEGAFLAQGTIYPDVIESGADNSANIKSHHNVGGLPKDMPFIGLVEPLRGLFKDEVRKLGKKLGLPEDIVSRQPFPGPGLAIRVIGEVTEEKLNALREADYIFREEMAAANVAASQYFAVLTDSRSVGVIGDFRNYGYVACLRAVITEDFMTAQFARLPYELLERVSSRIVNEVRLISRVCYDITGKPPATVEWE